MRGWRHIAIAVRLLRGIGPVGAADIEPGINEVEAARRNFVPERFISRGRHGKIRLDRAIMNGNLVGEVACKPAHRFVIEQADH